MVSASKIDDKNLFFDDFDRCSYESIIEGIIPLLSWDTGMNGMQANALKETRENVE